MQITRNSISAMTGLRILPPDRSAAIRDTVCSILGVTTFIVVLDALVFRAHLPRPYIALYTSPLMPRLWVISVMAGIEEIKFRLILMTGLALLFSLGRGRLTTPAAIAIILAAQFANVGHIVLADPVYGTLRYWLVGCVWGWLYWRHGWLTAFVGHVATHPVLDPALLFAFTHIAT